MGFPVGYSELFLPKLLLHLLFFLAYLRRFIYTAFSTLGLGDLLDSDAPWRDPPARSLPSDPQLPPHSASAILIQELLPVVRFEELPLCGEGQSGPVASDGCAVCLYGFEPSEEVRRLSNCRHIFHRGCLDRWVEHDQRTCPLCRTLLVPQEMQDAFDRCLWAAADVSSDSFAAPELYSSPSLLLPQHVLSSSA